MNGMIVYNLLYNIATDYRVKSIQLAFFKYNRYYPDHQTRKVFDDLLGFRTLCDNYEEICNLMAEERGRGAGVAWGEVIEVYMFITKQVIIIIQ